MAAKKGASTSGKRGISAPSNKYVQEQMKSGNPKPTADAPTKRSAKKPAKKVRK